jgi:hypothetical protein
VASDTRNGTLRNVAWPRDARDVLAKALPLLVCVAVGLLLPKSLQLAFLVVAGILGLAAFEAPTTTWVVAALVSSFTFQGLTFDGLLPPLGTYLPAPISWGALLAAVLRRQTVPSRARPYLGWLLALSAVAIVSGLFNHVELPRPFLSITLLGMPFAVLTAMLVDPPLPRERSLLMKITMGLIVLQIPVAYWQFVKHGSGDLVQGTLVSYGGGAHLLGAVALIGAILLFARQLTLWRVVLAAPLAVLPFIADAKQILFALPIAVLATAPQGVTLGYLLRSSAAVGLLAILLFVDPVGRTAIGELRSDQQQGGSPKAAVAKLIWNHMRSDPVSLTFGKGPAETVSLAAYYTTPGFLRSNSPLLALGLGPAEIAVEADALTYRGRGVYRSTFQSGVSSALGVFGDLGLMGILAYGGLLVTLLLALSRLRSPEGIGAMSAIALFGALGFIYGWWEVPALSVLAAVLAGIALTGETTPDRQARVKEDLVPVWSAGSHYGPLP